MPLVSRRASGDIYIHGQDLVDALDDAQLGRILAEDVVDTRTGEIIGECWERLSTNFLRRAAECKISKVKLLSRESNYICQVCNARFAISAKLAQMIMVEPVLQPVPAAV
jgi:hypothetical protein